MTILMAVPTLGQRPYWLAQCLQSIKSQGVDCRVIVVTPSAVKIDAMVKTKSVEHVICDEPGLSAGVNAVWRRNHNEDFVSWLGDDDLLAPGSLAITAAELVKRPDKGFAYGRTRYIDKDGETLFVSRPTRFAAAYLRLGKNFVPQQGSLIRRALAERLGYLDPTLMNAMDQDIFTRLHRLHGAIYIPKELSAYRLHESNITVVKGNSDESQQVRERYSRGWSRGGSGRKLQGLLSHGLYSIQKRLPDASATERFGFDYCRVDPASTA